MKSEPRAMRLRAAAARQRRAVDRRDSGFVMSVGFVGGQI